MNSCKMAFLAFICHNSSGFGKAKIVFFGLKFGHGCVLPVFSRGRRFRSFGLVMAALSVWCGMPTKQLCGVAGVRARCGTGAEETG